MQRTISAMVGKGSINHNSRKFKAENVDAERSCLNVDYCNESIKKVYHELFDEALARYNAKQTRAGRKIENYYEKIRSSKQEKPFHELILQIGDKENMGAESENGQLARQVLDEYYRGFQERNPQLRVFSAHLHLDEATPHLHIDFVPFTTGSKRGLDTRVSLKQALAAQGFKGGSRGDTEWSQWVLSEKEQLAAVMERYGIEWEQKGTHEKHLPVLDYKKQQRAEEIERLESKITDKQTEFETLSKRIENFDKGTTALSQMQNALENAPEYQLSEPQGFMTAKSYKSKVAEPLIKRLKSLIKTLMVRCFQAIDDYQRLNQTNASLYHSNERLKSQNRQLTSDNNRLREEIKDYKLLRKVFGSKQIDNLLEQARQSKQRGTCFRNKENER
ncbi:plasmid recombination protein [Ligilactobacillus murinus]|jgi:cell division protein FtsB|nr:plasmid recombination protein [Ligilactobacillus murinus]MCZ0695226.1 plasmid recombination protein [Ligilactobacillus murinus]